MNHRLIFLGTGAGSGVPSFYCGCPACREALDNPLYCRTCCSLAIQGEATVLVDAPPDLRMQLIRENIHTINALFLTHRHYDHTGGLGELEFYSRLKAREALPAFMSSETAGWLNETHEFMRDCFKIEPFSLSSQAMVDGIVYTALEASHTPGTIGLLMETPSGKRAAYLPDTGPLTAETAGKLHNVDILILDATFWGENRMPTAHLSVDSAVQTGLALNAGQVYLTHLSMHHDRPVTSRELENYIKQYGDHIHLAYDGGNIDFS